MLASIVSADFVFDAFLRHGCIRQWRGHRHGWWRRRRRNANWKHGASSLRRLHAVQHLRQLVRGFQQILSTHSPHRPWRIWHCLVSSYSSIVFCTFSLPQSSFLCGRLPHAFSFDPFMDSWQQKNPDFLALFWCLVLFPEP